MQFVASGAATIFLVSFCVYLSGPAFDLPTYTRQGTIAAGALPQFTVVTVGLLAVMSFGADLFQKLRNRETPEADVNFSANPRTVVLVGFSVLVLLSAFLFVWQTVNFPVAAMLFMASMSALITPQEYRTAKGYAVMAGTSLFFCGSVWLAFVHLLVVPLR